MAKGGTSRSGADPSGDTGPDTGPEDRAVTDMGYEEARTALGEVVAALEAGNVTLEEALDLWERGERYAAQCERWLDGAQARLDAGSDEAIDDEA